MKVIVGLGNPGKKYRQTRHNAGFLAVDFFIEHSQPKTKNFRSSFHCEILETKMANKKTFLVKPQTFMNNSGLAVKKICDFYKINPAAGLLIIHDDTDLPFGLIRANMSSSSAGHNGAQNIIDELGTQNFRRIRVGVETRSSRGQLPTETFVLRDFTEEELKRLAEDVLPQVNLEIEKFIAS